MKDLMFKRKIEKKLEEWNSDPNKVPLIVEGLRQVGKSYTVNKFAHDHYPNVVTFDFRHNKSLREIFDGDLDVDSIVRNSVPYFPDKSFIPHETILIFEEIGDCPLARTSLKSFALDGRFPVIATGSLLGVLNYRRKQKVDIPTGYEKTIQMSSMDFEEFLWANGLNEEQIGALYEYVKNYSEMPSSLASYYKEMIKRYVVIGGMPDSVKAFLTTNNYIKSRECLEGLIKDYRADFGRFINEKNEEEVDYRLQATLNKLFDSIPSQLARESDTSKFKYSEVKKGGRSIEFEEPFDWLEKAGLVYRCFNVNAIEKPLEANTDKTYFKAFLSDIGLLMAMYPLSASQEFLRDELDSRKGAIFENMAATMIKKAGFPLYYFSNGTDHLEIDFLLESEEGIILLEEKSTNGKMAASRAVMEGKTKYKATKCLKIIRDNFGVGSFYTSVPHCSLPFILGEMRKKLEEGVFLKPLEYPAL
ncbi:MAG: ATP-binding protein [Bacilli bacterium]|nr:ATP-binding protein [Bacilli bacterium]